MYVLLFETPIVTFCVLPAALKHVMSQGYTVLMSPKKDEAAVHCVYPALSVLVMFGVSKRLSRSISLAVYCLF